jgi:hypothetical protein
VFLNFKGLQVGVGRMQRKSHLSSFPDVPAELNSVHDPSALVEGFPCQSDIR